MTEENRDQLVAKRLRTGDIAVWDAQGRRVILISSLKEEGSASVRIVRGAELKALDEALGSIIFLG
jgi:hypothetical protein